MAGRFQNDAAEIKVRAEIRAGEILAEMDLRGGDRRSRSKGQRVTLNRLGVEPKESERWQAMAKIPEKKREQYMATARAHAEEITTSGVLKLAQRADTASLLLHNESVEWYTPPEIIESARQSMGAPRETTRPIRDGLHP